VQVSPAEASADASTSVDRTLGDHVIRLVKLIHAGRHRAPRMHPDVDPMAYPLLFRIGNEQCRLSDLAAAFHTELSTLSRQVSGFVDLGLVTKEPDPRDRRAQVLVLTADGHALLDSVRAMRDEWVDAMTADWSDAERETFATLLGRFGDSVEQQAELRAAQRASDLPTS
jgi:DNA-binding MarR family transcriptional regulator